MVPGNDEAAVLKDKVRLYWASGICDTREHLVWKGKAKDAIPYPKFSREYFEEIERRRVASQAFSESEKRRGKRVLEVGGGSGVGFVQWVRNGAEAYGVDLTMEAVHHTRRWLGEYGLPGYARVQVGDAERLPYLDGAFDMVWSWGVAHHSPDTLRVIKECVRVTKPGGEIKLML